MASQYLYTGYDARAYIAYVDTSTGKMLQAEPGGTYGIRAGSPGLPVPPADGRWDAVTPARPAVKAAKAEGGAA